MIIFDRQRYIEDIKRDGIGAADPYAKQKMQTIMNDFVQNSTYKSGKIIEKVMGIASDYFNGLPDAIAKEELKGLYGIAKEKAEKGVGEERKKEITLYKSEMQTLAALENENLQKLAFAALVVHKYIGQYNDNGNILYHSYIKCCEKDIYRIADIKNVSGATKNKLWKMLSDMGLVKFRVNTNASFRFNPQWIALPVFTVTFNEDIAEEESNKEVFMDVTNYDDIMLYWRLYMGDKDVTLCKDCGCPIERENGKQYCRICAKKRKKASDNKRYKKGKIRKSA